MSDKKIKLTYRGKEYEFPVVEGTEGDVAIDIKDLRARTGLITLDYGFKNTASTESAITFLDGEKGILKHRGYSIEYLAGSKSFLEVSYLLIFGELPNKKELDTFSSDIKQHYFVNERLIKIIDRFPTTSHPMGVLSSAVSALTAFHSKSNLPDSEERYNNVVKLLAKLPVLSALSYRKQKGLPINYPNRKLEYVENFLSMMFSMPNEEYTPPKYVVDAVNLLLILHADHEQNCSTATVRMVGSADSSLYASVSAGISALWGPLHGGANQAVIEMLEMIISQGGSLQKWIDKAKDKDDPFRLMGFGHRVYKNFDPRSKIIKKYADKILSELGVKDQALSVAKELEEIALKDEYFIEKKLFPNIDFYSGIIYKALNIPTEMFTVMFALGRVPGWIAQWKELKENREPIGRPRQVYIGKTDRGL